MKCKCGADAHPCYGNRCENCWAQGARNSTSCGNVPLSDKVKHPHLYGYPEAQVLLGFGGYWHKRGRIVRKS